jgi:chromosome segregation ATPase
VQGEVESVKLQRMSNSMITDKRNMFELLTKILDRARKDRDAELVTYVEQATELWTAMMMEECDHDQKCIKNVHDMKDVCDAWLKELLSILEGGSAEAFEREKQTQKQAQGMKVAELEQEVKRMEGLMQESEKAPVSSRDAEQRCASLEEKLQDLERALAQASEALEREKQTQGMKVAELEQEVKRMEGLMQESEKAPVSSRDAEQRCASLEEKLQDLERALAQASEALEREKQTQGMKVAELEQEVKRMEGLLLQESEKASVSSRDAEQRCASLEEKLQDLERALAQASEALELVEGLLQESEKASVSSRDAEQRCASLEEKLQDRERALAQASAETGAAKASLKDVRDEIERLKKLLADKEAALKQLEDELKKLCEQVAALTEERDKLANEGAVSADLEAELKKMREQLASLKEERDKLTEELEMLAVTRSELWSKTAENEAAKDALKDAQDEIERPKKPLADKEAALKQLEDKENIFGLQRAIELATLTMEEVAKEHLADHACVTSTTHSSNTTVGLSVDIKNATVSGVLVGGPAFNSKQVHKDDMIVAVDGQAVQGNQILDMLKGVDKPGSVVTLTLKRTSVSASSFGMLSPPLHSREKC